MRCLFLIPIFVFFSFINPLSSQTKWQVATILLENKSIRDLQNLGLALDHGHYHPGESFTGDFTLAELEKIQKAGFKIEYKTVHQLDPRNAPGNCNPDVDPIPEYKLPVNYEFGSMNGFQTLDQIYDALELMQILYPNLITIKKPIGLYKTYEGESIYYVKISDNPQQDENEPEVLYTALHHAREPVSMSQMIFFMWHLLENYNKDSLVANLVNCRELFFIPCLNPDGYKYNQLTNPQGGGYWRKNRNPNPDDIGTDLNRNYEEGWGFDNDGSSGLGSSEVYRGVKPFSEIETKAIREFCENRNFSIAMNYHSHGDILIIPWGYLDKPTADSTLYLSMALNMTRYNNFKIGTSTQTLAYKVNGVADDWMYGEQIFKNKILAFTPEVGPDFWPARKDITRLNQSTQYMNFMAAWNAGESAHLKETSPAAISSDTSYLQFSVTRTGILQAPVFINCTSDKSYIRFLDNDLEVLLNPGESKLVSVQYVIEGNPKKGDTISFDATLSTGCYTEFVTMHKAFVGESNWAEDFFNDRSWFKPELFPWKLTTETYVTPPHALTDSPNSPMEPLTRKVYRNSKPIDLRTVKYAYLRFNAKWQMADDEDYVQVQIADNSLDFISLCGKYTKNGTGLQVSEEPVYCGKQKNWVTEWIDLKDHLGKVMQLQVLLSSSLNVEKNDGFYIDDIEVFTDLNTQVLDENDFWNAEVFPQPAHDQIHIQLKNTSSADVNFQLVSAAGIEQLIDPVFENNTWTIETTSLVPGFYFLSLQFKDQKPRLFKVVIN